MRYIKDLLLEKVALHVIDTSGDEVVVGHKPLMVTQEVEEFVRKHIVKSLNSDETFSGRFLSDDTVTGQVIKSLVEDHNEFMDASITLAERMFEVTRNTDIPSGDLLFAQYVADEQRCFAVIKLDYQSYPTHHVFTEDEDVTTALVSNHVLLPKTGQGLKKCAFFTKGNEGVDMIVLNKRQKIEDGNEDYFVSQFLEAVLVKDDTVKTREFKATVEKWTQKNLSEQIEKATTVREMTNEALIDEDVINIEEYVDCVIDNINVNDDVENIDVIAKSLKEGLETQGYKADDEFYVDKVLVDKKMKTRQIKTDTGLVIKGDMELFNDAQRFAVRKNGDGTVDYIIKNVRAILEK